METIVSNFTDSHPHISYKFAPHRYYILVYGTCSIQWTFFYPLLKGICSNFYAFQVGFVQAFPFPLLVSGEWSQSKFAIHL